MFFGIKFMCVIVLRFALLTELLAFVETLSINNSKSAPSNIYTSPNVLPGVIPTSNHNVTPVKAQDFPSNFNIPSDQSSDKSDSASNSATKSLSTTKSRLSMAENNLTVRTNQKKGVYNLLEDAASFFNVFGRVKDELFPSKLPMLTREMKSVDLANSSAIYSTFCLLMEEVRMGLASCSVYISPVPESIKWAEDNNVTLQSTAIFYEKKSDLSFTWPMDYRLFNKLFEYVITLRNLRSTDGNDDAMDYVSYKAVPGDSAQVYQVYTIHTPPKDNEFLSDSHFEVMVKSPSLGLNHRAKMNYY